jgi:hypothetical protein
MTLILLVLMMEAKLSSETSVLTRDTRLHIPEDGILRHSYSLSPSILPETETRSRD